MTRKYFDPDRHYLVKLFHKFQNKYRKTKKKCLRLLQRLKWYVLFRVLGIDPGPLNHKWVYDPTGDTDWQCLFRCAKCFTTRLTTRKPKRNKDRFLVPGSITWPRYDKRVHVGTKKLTCEQYLLWSVMES